MFELYELVCTKNECSYKDLDGNTITIPKGSHAYIIEKHDGWYTVEFTDDVKVFPPIADFYEYEIELVK